MVNGKDSFRFLHGKELRDISESRRSKYIQAGFRFWRSKGFPFPVFTKKQLIKAYFNFAYSEKLALRRNRQLAWSPLGFSVANTFHPEMWSTKCERFRTPVEVFLDDEMFFDCISRAVRLWADRKPLTPANIRQMLATYVNTKRVSNFRPTVARALYERYTEDGDVILDPAAGYGGRMLGVLPLKRTYIGIDPNIKAHRGNIAMLNTLVGVKLAKVILINKCAEHILRSFGASTVNLVIFSPPYFKRERYSNETTQSWLRYPTYDEWYERFLTEVLKQCQRVLKKGGFIALNVANTENHCIAKDALEICRKLFKFHYYYKMLIGSVPYHRNGKHGGFRYEPIYIYRK